MIIIIVLYAVLIWLIFFRFKSLPFNWVFGSLAAVIGICIALTFVGLLSYLTPSGKIEVMGKVNEVTPNVSGQVTEIPVKPNVLVKAGTTLFQIDRAPYEYKVRQLKAALAEAKQKVGTTVKLVFANSPGRIYEAQIREIVRGVGEGQFAASGALARVASVGLTMDYPVRISTPKDIDPTTLRLGMAGAATAFSDSAGPIGVLASILLWVTAYAMYL
jgi:multidrug efflux pump subunit AcrA (membrane-fusion protein)